MKEQKRSSKTMHIVSYALIVSVNGVICVFIAHFRGHQEHFVAHLGHQAHFVAGTFESV